MDLKYWIWLSSLPGIGGNKAIKLLEYFKDPKNVWDAEIKELSHVDGIGKSLASVIKNEIYKEAVFKHMENLIKYGVKAIPINSPEYPQMLRLTYDPPAVLYMRGSLLKKESCIAIVGSRNATQYGQSISINLAEGLGTYGFTIVSGLAKGIDSAAHEGALKAGSRTIAVLGHGLDTVYPVENSPLFNRIINHGAAISEYLPGFPVLPGNFPARNRIISGLSSGVIVVEAGERSGSLITANLALEQGREVFAIPGNVVNKNSKGTNKLIKDGAKMVTEIQDIIDELRVFLKTKEDRAFLKTDYGKGKKKETEVKAPENLNEIQKKIFIELNTGKKHIDVIAKNLSIPVSEVNAALILMEIKGYVQTLPGKIFEAVDK